MERKLNYSGEQVSVRRDLVDDKVIPAWPKIGVAVVCPIGNFINEHLDDDVEDPRRCLLPEPEWPEEVPRSKVHASDAEWYSVCKAGAARGIFCGGNFPR